MDSTKLLSEVIRETVQKFFPDEDFTPIMNGETIPTQKLAMRILDSFCKGPKAMRSEYLMWFSHKLDARTRDKVINDGNEVTDRVFDFLDHLNHALENISAGSSFDLSWLGICDEEESDSDYCSVLNKEVVSKLKSNHIPTGVASMIATVMFNNFRNDWMSKDFVSYKLLKREWESTTLTNLKSIVGFVRKLKSFYEHVENGYQLGLKDEIIGIHDELANQFFDQYHYHQDIINAAIELWLYLEENDNDYSVLKYRDDSPLHEQPDDVYMAMMKLQLGFREKVDEVVRKYNIEKICFICDLETPLIYSHWLRRMYRDFDTEVTFDGIPVLSLGNIEHIFPL